MGIDSGDLNLLWVDGPGRGPGIGDGRVIGPRAAEDLVSEGEDEGLLSHGGLVAVLAGKLGIGAGALLGGGGENFVGWGGVRIISTLLLVGSVLRDVGCRPKRPGLSHDRFRAGAMRAGGKRRRKVWEGQRQHLYVQIDGR